MNAENIALKARKLISRFCMEECKSYCCRKGYLVLNHDNVDLVTNSIRKQLEDKKLLKLIGEGKYSLDLCMACPSLKEYKCLIHRNPKRPEACKQFPIFLEGNTVKLSTRCLAVKMNLFYPYIHQLLKLGYKLVRSNLYSDSDFYKILN